MPLGDVDDPVVQAWGRRVVALSNRIETVVAQSSDADVVVALCLCLLTMLEETASRKLLPPMEAMLPHLKLIVATFGAYEHQQGARH